MPYIFLYGCNIEEPAIDIAVIPEQVMQISGDQVRLSGRIIASGSLKIVDHGFEISPDEEFNIPLIISLGSKTNPGRFFGEIGDLSISTTYFWRPFFIVGEEIRYGESGTFSTLTPSILDYNPKIGLAGTLVTIEGSNLTEDIQVFIDGRNAQISERVLDTKIKVFVPPLENNRFAKVKLIAQDIEPGFEFNIRYEYIIGKWEQLGSFITNANYQKTISMVVGDQLIFGLGLENFTRSNNLWTHDIGTDTWTPLDFTGSAVESPFSAAPYFGGGSINFGLGTILNSNEFYKYEQNQIVSMGVTPFKLSRSMAFLWDNKLYVIGGELENRTINRTIFQYDLTSGTWNTLGKIPREFVSDYPYFQYQEKLFFIEESGILWQYNIESEVWDTISEFPSRMGNIGISEVIGSKAYIGLFRNNRNIIEYDILQNTWLPKAPFKGDFLEENGGSWAYNDQVYLLKNTISGSDKPMTSWSFSPEEF